MKLSEIKPGDRLRADDAFTCLDAGEIVTVEADLVGRLYVPCRGGHAGEPTYHYLDGQVAFDDQETIIGLERGAPPASQREAAPSAEGTP